MEALGFRPHFETSAKAPLVGCVANADESHALKGQSPVVEDAPHHRSQAHRQVGGRDHQGIGGTILYTWRRLGGFMALTYDAAP